MTTFGGRHTDLARLTDQLRRAAGGSGSAVVLTGRRRVGKSRLVQEFCDRSGAPYVVFQATRGRPAAAERADLLTAVGQSDLPGADLLSGLTADDWNQALRALTAALPDDRPSVVVIDELPWLVEQDPSIEGALQTVWDQHLSRKPVLLILVGSDLAVMEALQTYGRPFFGRAARMVLRPLDPHDVAELTGLAAPDAIDAYLITGGYPEIVLPWRSGMSRFDFLRENLTNPLSPLLMAGELTMLGEFPEPTIARAVLAAVGAGETTYRAIATEAGGGTATPDGSLAPVLRSLLDKRVLVADLPLSAKADNRNKRYRVADQYLRFWLAFLQRGIAESERGRGDLVLTRIERSWPAWRGRAVEPVVRESLERLLPNPRWPATGHVGGWWNRQNNPELDLVGADRAPIARSVEFLGSIKWLDRPFQQPDLDRLIRDGQAVPGAGPDTPLVAVSRAGVDPGLALADHWGPAELVAAWAPAGARPDPGEWPGE